MVWTILLTVENDCLVSSCTLKKNTVHCAHHVTSKTHFVGCCLLLLPCLCRYCGNWRIMREWAATSTRSLRFPWPDTESTGRRLSLCSETQWVKCGIWQVSLIPRLCGGEKSRMRLTRLCCVVFLPLQQIKWKWISTYWLNCGIFS